MPHVIEPQCIRYTATDAFWGALPVSHATIAYAASVVQRITMLFLFLGPGVSGKHFLDWFEPYSSCRVHKVACPAAFQWLSLIDPIFYIGSLIHFLKDTPICRAWKNAWIIGELHQIQYAVKQGCVRQRNAL